MGLMRSSHKNEAVLSRIQRISAIFFSSDEYYESEHFAWSTEKGSSPLLSIKEEWIWGFFFYELYNNCYKMFLIFVKYAKIGITRVNILTKRKSRSELKCLIINK